MHYEIYVQFQINACMNEATKCRKTPEKESMQL